MRIRFIAPVIKIKNSLNNIVFLKIYKYPNRYTGKRWENMF